MTSMPSRTHAAPTVYQRSRPRVLVVDDDALIRRLLERMLAHLGCVVLSAETGDAACEIARAHPRLALGIVDRSLPDVDGLSLVETLRGILGAAAPPFVTFSGHEPLDPLPPGIVASLTKPMRMDELVAAVRAVIAPGRRPLPRAPTASRSLTPTSVPERFQRALATLTTRGQPRARGSASELGPRATLRDPRRER